MQRDASPCTQVTGRWIGECGGGRGRGGGGERTCKLPSQNRRNSIQLEHKHHEHEDTLTRSLSSDNVKNDAHHQMVGQCLCVKKLIWIGMYTHVNSPVVPPAKYWCWKVKFVRMGDTKSAKSNWGWNPQIESVRAGLGSVAVIKTTTAPNLRRTKLPRNNGMAPSSRQLASSSSTCTSFKKIAPNRLVRCNSCTSGNT